MYQLSGGIAGGNIKNDGISNGCSTIEAVSSSTCRDYGARVSCLYHHYGA